jgi:hypothetical protein
MKPLLFLALMTCLTWTTNASAQDRHMYLGPRQPAVDVLTLTGFGTNNAVAQGRVTERSARAHCDNFYTPETATKMAQCIADHLQEHAKSYQISADCDGGRITSVFGDRFTFAGQRRRTSEGDTPNVSLWTCRTVRPTVRATWWRRTGASCVALPTAPRRSLRGPKSLSVWRNQRVDHRGPWGLVVQVSTACLTLTTARS